MHEAARRALDALWKSPHARRLSGLTFWLAAAVIAYHWVGRLGESIFVRNGDQMDFATYYAAAASLRFRPGASIYDLHALQQVAHLHQGCAVSIQAPYLYPPLLAILWEPVTLLPCSAAYQGWLIVNAALWLACTALLAARLRAYWPRHPRLATLAVMAGSLLSYALLGGYALGQVHILLLLVFLLLPELASRNRLYTAGALIALAICIKPQTLPLLAYYAARGRWRAVRAALVAGAALIVVMLALNGNGLQGLLDATRAMTRDGNAVARFPWNEALLQRPYGQALVALVLLGYGLGLWLGRRGDDYAGLAWTVATIVLISPIAWWFYYGWLPPVAVAAVGLPRSLLLRAAVAGLYVTTIVHDVPGRDAVWLHPGVALALWLVTGALYLRSARHAHPGDDATQSATPRTERDRVAVSQVG